MPKSQITTTASDPHDDAFKPIRVSWQSLDALQFVDPMSDELLRDEVDDDVEKLIDELTRRPGHKRRSN